MFHHAQSLAPTALRTGARRKRDRRLRRERADVASRGGLCSARTDAERHDSQPLLSFQRVRRLLIWSGIDAWRAEVAAVQMGSRSLSAAGTQLGVEPVPYRVDYQLEVGETWITRRLNVRATGEGWARELDLRHDGAGAWTAEAGAEGAVALPAPGGDAAAVNGALDCDLGLCPLTNVMPVRRHELHRRVGEVDFLMAWVSVPDLGLHPSRQRYEHVGRRGDRLVVRYVGEHRSFVGELELDDQGLVLLYPELARRLA